MKKIMRKVGGYVAALALTVVAADVNSACAFLVYQPELPAEAAKLSKIKS